MNPKILFFSFFLLLPFLSVGQGNPMFISIDRNDPCCINVEMNPAILSQHPSNWHVVIGEKKYTSHDLDQNLSFRHCFPTNGAFTVQFYGGGGLVYANLVYISGCMNIVNGFHYVHLDGCCVEVSIINFPPKRKWSINMGDGAVFSNTTFPNDVVYYCYETPGKYMIQVFYDGGGGAGHQVEIIADSCRDVCNYWLCQTDYATAFGCSGSVTLSIDGVEVTIPFSQPITNATQGIPALVNEFQNIANLYGLTYVNVAPHVAHCPKSPDDPDSWGHFFLNSHVKFISLNAEFGCSEPQTPNAGWKKVNFKNDCD
jgi:hypothetical protein